MAAPAFFVMLKGPPKDLLKFQCEVLPKVEVVWAAMGEFIVDAPWYFPPKGFKAWDFHIVLKVADQSVLNRALAATSLQSFVLEVEPKKYHPSKLEMKEAEKMAPSNEPEGIEQVAQRNWEKILTPKGIFRNVVRGVRIVYWISYYGILKGKLWHPFHMVNLLKFEGSEKTYDMYRDSAGRLVMADGGHLAFLGNVKRPDSNCFDEVMIVAYKHHFQFLKMALLTPAYWPLSMLRDEGLQDGMLHVTDPLHG